VTETALSTALNSSYMAESLSLFGILVGIALLLSGIGFGILASAERSGASSPRPSSQGTRTPKDTASLVLPTA
jgi:F0F1-type ATP synthase membrane subunit c/vacuolar-type H+-ATPase subunit K